MMANPNTKLVTKVLAPNDNTIDNWNPAQFMIAVYPNEDAKKAISSTNPSVLPITQEKLDELELKEYTVFESDDKSWTSAFPNLQAELEAYNTSVKEAADTAGVPVTSEKFIAYKYDTALGQLLSNVLPQNTGLVGFVLAALLGAIVSSLAAMLNAASTIFTMDIYTKYISPKAQQKSIVTLGRICVVVFAVVAVWLAPKLGDPNISNSIFTIIQEVQGLLSPGILAVFAFAGVAGLVTNIVCYGGMYLLGRYNVIEEIQFLNRMAICFGINILVMIIITVLKPMDKPIVFEQKTSLNLKSSSGAFVAGIIVIIITLALYFLFSPIGLAK
jgi:SSS family solute:Na+ symporter